MAQSLNEKFLANQQRRETSEIEDEISENAPMARAVCLHYHCCFSQTTVINSSTISLIVRILRWVKMLGLVSQSNEESSFYNLFNSL